MTATKPTRRMGRLPGDLLVAAVSTAAGVALTWWVLNRTQVPVAAWTALLIAVLVIWVLGVLSGRRKNHRRQAEVS